MSVTDTRTNDPDAGTAPARLSTVLRTKRTIAALRICVFAVVMVIFLSSAGIRAVAGSAALVILVCAGVYAFVSLVISTRGEGRKWRRIKRVSPMERIERVFARFRDDSNFKPARESPRVPVT